MTGVSTKNGAAHMHRLHTHQMPPWLSSCPLLHPPGRTEQWPCQWPGCDPTCGTAVPAAHQPVGSSNKSNSNSNIATATRGKRRNVGKKPTHSPTASSFVAHAGMQAGRQCVSAQPGAVLHFKPTVYALLPGRGRSLPPPCTCCCFSNSSDCCWLRLLLPPLSSVWGAASSTAKLRLELAQYLKHTSRPCSSCSPTTV